MEKLVHFDPKAAYGRAWHLIEQVVLWIYEHDEDLLADDETGAIPDLYQVLAYAVRFKIDEIALLYPDSITSSQNESTNFTIRDEFADQVDVRVIAYQLPVINREMFDGSDAHGQQLKELFSETENRLRQRIRRVLD